MDNAFFMASKLAWVFLSPINLIAILMSFATIALVFNKITFAKWLLLPTMLLSVLLLIYPISDSVMYPLESRFQKPDELPVNIDGIIVLGGGEELKLSLDWHTAEMGNGGDRFFAAALLAKTYPLVPVIFSGGSGLLDSPALVTELSVAKDLLTGMGINESRLIIESSSRNTYENFVFLSSVLPQRSGRYLLITSAFHMPRSVGVARNQGFNVIPYPVDYRSNSTKLRQYDFSLFEHLQVLEPAWKEWIGLTVYYWTGKTSSWFPAMEP
jgi:uncharacterized SAM-binding protein YcdF (DUF218 family)